MPPWWTCGIALGLARALALLLPFRLRPVHTEALDFKLPLGTTPTLLEGWSAFPSDHAVLFFGLAAEIGLVSRRRSWFAVVYTTVVIAFPRIYLGLHFPTDIVAGALIGGLVVLTANRLLAGHSLIRRMAATRRRQAEQAGPLDQPSADGRLAQAANCR